MKRYGVMSAVLALALGLAGCEGFGDAMTSHTGVVARAAGHELTVEEMVDLLAGNPRIPAQNEVVQSVAELWVDYTIMADLAAEDSLLSALDLDALMEQYVEQRTFQELISQVVTTDTVFTEAELRELYAQENRGVRVRARHILFQYPTGATSEQRDSVRALADRVREQAAGGGDFAALAREHSDDPGSASQGGDLDWFGAGEMVKPFEDAAFDLQPGEVSEVVETLHGLHIIKVEERQSQSLDEVGEDFRQQVVAQRRQESVDEYVTGLTEPVEPEVDEGALDVARDLARNPNARLSGRAANRRLVTWDGGAVTAREFLQASRRLAPQQRAQVAAMRDEQLEPILLDLATNELVLTDAESRGVSIPEAERDSVRDMVREQVIQVARQAGFFSPPTEGEGESDAVERRVRSLLQSILSGQQSPLPLGSLTYVLRQGMEWQIHERTFPAVVERLQDRRESAGAQQPMPQMQLPQRPPADTGAGGGGAGGGG